MGAVMRNLVPGLVTVRAIAGTHVVFLAFDMAQNDAQGLMGFAIQRTDLTEDETIWLRGNKTFASVRQTTGIEDANSHDHPFQSFQWADYSAKPGYRYRYRVIPMFGTAGHLTEGPATVVEIGTEPLNGTKHSVHFNRGAIASQAFVKRFPGQTLNQAGAPGSEWLGRDLVPALLRFIARAEDGRYSLHAALYELSRPEGQPWADIPGALKAAADRGAQVRLLYHAKADDTGADNRADVQGAGLQGVAVERTNAKLMHNKFIVLSRDGAPVAVWTGSTNISRNALYGQLNCGHMVNDAATAREFLAYWTMLATDPDADTLKNWVEANNAMPPLSATDTIVPVFSPHRGRAVFDWWIALASAGKPLFMTFPFGIVKDFRPVFDRNDGVLRFALLDKYVNGGNATSRAAAIAEIERIRGHPNIGMALGNRIAVDWVDGWRREQNGIGVNVDWVHTKFMLIDPLGERPVTLAGSANFSEPSVDDNDENMLLIRGNKRVADIYFGEFMRIFAHHRFRESVKRHIERHGTAAFDTWKPQDLFEDWRKWVPGHFAAGSEYDIKRRYFAGS
jgi:phosphatidylserine/phosphatidylglycerophosphate/cardiolipin synthase-like enzyme